MQTTLPDKKSKSDADEEKRLLKSDGKVVCGCLTAEQIEKQWDEIHEEIVQSTMVWDYGYDICSICGQMFEIFRNDWADVCRTCPYCAQCVCKGCDPHYTDGWSIASIRKLFSQSKLDR